MADELEVSTTDNSDKTNLCRNLDDQVSADEEDQVKTLKYNLDGWKKVLHPFYSILMWEQPYYPAILAVMVTLEFILLWYFEPSLLTTLSLLGVTVCVADYAVPIVCVTFFDATKWTDAEERKFEEICKSVILVKQQTCDFWTSVIQLRDTKPVLYFVSVMSVLLLVAWIGSVINNLVLAYFLELGLVMLPGLKHQGILQNSINQVKNILGQKIKKN
ncbi:ADP-ribosylation factor-like protein 6-interacting protein 1 [Limulus polyphemus]|uniref:ADP-ribosylation factor-like protein 6-interacting protein 1 n=1 Tax=Limulus polyphemus TaxID=6850 RepID=A0ABM1BWQ0_LIMPO|nr:ADP-ribosylation factor-like protein 6-interacting protein 1 [Limulus polyphemus]